MQTIFFLVMRRMRVPLLVLILAYTVAVLGFVLIPGVDADGRPWRVGFFHAFYIVSYTATTIGFGELPHAFNDAQRLWLVLVIYLAVVAWLYSIGSLLTLVQDPAFRRAVVESRFTRRVRGIRNDFFLICGFGETGGALVRTLSERGVQSVVVEVDEGRVNLLKMEDWGSYVYALSADAGVPRHLLEAGLQHPRCKGVAALTNSNEVNLKIALTSKLLHPEITVICRADSHAVENNMRSFGTDHIIDPFDTFALHLATAFQIPCLYLLQRWLSGLGGGDLHEDRLPPHRGLWILCGYGRFGKAVFRRLREEGLETVVVEAYPEQTGRPPAVAFIKGRGTDADTLEQAGIKRAVGLVVGTDDDATNLSIVLTARQMNPDLYLVARQNLLENQALFDAVRADMVMHPSSIIANRIRSLLAVPLLSRFVGLAFHEQDHSICQLTSRIAGLVDEAVPDVWELTIDPEDAFALDQTLGRNQVVRLEDILRDPRERECKLPVIALMLVRGRSSSLVPSLETGLARGDRLLLCGDTLARDRMKWTLQNQHALNYVTTGESRPQGWVWRWLAKPRRWG
jgi:voltage-gated potassium channel